MVVRITRRGTMALGLLVLLLLAAGLLLWGRQVPLLAHTSARPEAVATVHGGPLAPGLEGTVEFRRFGAGTLVSVRVKGLPPYRPGEPPIGPHGFHIHDFGDCEVGDPASPFESAGGHWNPDNQPHGNHAGDFPVLFSNGGVAMMEFYTNRFRPADVIGKAVVIHENPDDYRTQPAGASGRRLACGPIEAVVR